MVYMSHNPHGHRCHAFEVAIYRFVSQERVDRVQAVRDIAAARAAFRTKMCNLTSSVAIVKGKGSPYSITERRVPERSRYLAVSLQVT